MVTLINRSRLLKDFRFNGSLEMIISYFINDMSSFAIDGPSFLFLFSITDVAPLHAGLAKKHFFSCRSCHIAGQFHRDWMDVKSSFIHEHSLILKVRWISQSVSHSIPRLAPGCHSSSIMAIQGNRDAPRNPTIPIELRSTFADLSISHEFIVIEEHHHHNPLALQYLPVFVFPFDLADPAHIYILQAGTWWMYRQTFDYWWIYLLSQSEVALATQLSAHRKIIPPVLCFGLNFRLLQLTDPKPFQSFRLNVLPPFRYNFGSWTGRNGTRKCGSLDYYVQIFPIIRNLIIPSCGTLKVTHLIM